MLAKLENWSAKGHFDSLGLGLAGLCLVHCLASAVIITVLASAGGILLHPAVHEIGMVFALLFGGLALISGFYRHGFILPLAIGSVGLGMMLGALTLPHGGGEILYTIVGLAVLALGHDLNYRATH